MPQYGKPTGRDTIENLLKRVDELENTVKRLSGSPHRSSMDRGDTASVADPIEGQTLIQYDSEAAKYYSNGAWRAFAGAAASDAAWCRVRMWNNASNQTINSGSETQMHFNDVQEDDPNNVFTGTASGGVNDGIVVNSNGLYLIRARMYWASASDPAQAVISLNGIDSDHFAPYNVGQVDTSSLTAGFVSTWARLQATQSVYVTVIQSSGSSKQLYGTGGNFLEMALIDTATVTAIAGGP